MLYCLMLAHLGGGSAPVPLDATPVGWRRAAIILRAERGRLQTLAARADRGLRTQTARRCATEAHNLFGSVVTSSPSAPLQRIEAVHLLTRRPGWTVVAPDQVACTFGARHVVIKVPALAYPYDLALLMARTELRVLLGDSPLELIAHLQTIAVCELRHLFGE